MENLLHQLKKYYDFLPQPIVFFNKFDFAIFYQNKNYQKLSKNELEEIYENAKFYVLYKKQPVQYMHFFEHEENLIGCIINRDFNLNEDLNEESIINNSESLIFDLSTNQNITNSSSLIKKLGCSNLITIDEFFEIFSNQFEETINPQITKIFTKDQLILNKNLSYEFKSRQNQYLNISVFVTTKGEKEVVIVIVSDLTEYKLKLNKAINERKYLLNSVIKSYDFISLIDIRKNTIEVILNKINKVDEFTSFSSFIDNLVNTEIYYEDIEKFKKLLAPNYIVKKITSQETSYSFTVRQKNNESYSFKEYSILKDDHNLNNFVLCCKDVSSQIEKQQIIKNLTASYKNACYIDLNNDTYYFIGNKNNDDFDSSFTNYVEKNFISNVSLEDKEKLKEFFDLNNLKQTLKESSTQSIKIKITKDNEDRYIQLFCMANNIIDDEIISAVLLLTDITDAVLQEINTKLLLNAAVETVSNASNSKTKLLSRISHDLRTPLTSIIGMTNLALSNLNDTKKLTKQLEVIESSSKHLLDLIEEILDLSRIESGKLHVNEQEFNLDDLLKEVNLLIEPIAQRQGLKYHFSQINLKHKYLIGDKKRIKQVLINLLSNAIKYNKPNGKVNFKIIGEDKLDVNLTKITFIVEDSGIGMSPEFLKIVFQPFTRADEDKEGTGLGLTISKVIVDLLDGEMNVKSVENKGTTFKVMFNIKINHNIVEEKYEEILPIAENVLEGKKILLVDDNIINIEIAKEIIENTKASVITAKNGVDAVNKYKEVTQNYFDLIFMDIQMPVKNGYLATKEIREINKDIPIIGMSANAFADEILKGKECGMNDYLSKPVEPKQILKMMLKYIK